MGAESAIEWTHATFNIVWGCTKVSPGCENCYAEKWAKRTGLGWGPKAVRRTMSAAYWREPLKWDRAAAQAGERRRVFCSSMADVFEDHPTVEQERAKLWRLIAETPHLDWQLLTKRPQNVARMVPWGNRWPTNVWIGVSVEDQKRADERVPLLLSTPAVVRFLSCEPLLGPIDLRGWGDHAPSADDAYTAPASWDAFAWPEWVPVEQRRQIERFWAPSYCRGPRDWLRDHTVQRVPATGARVTCAVDRNGWASVDKMAHAGVTGLYLHAWNNIGRIVTDDGRLVYASGGIGSGWLSRWLTPQGDYRSKLSWVIVGGESGHGARPFDVAWARSIVSQCRAATVPCFVKQLGAKAIGHWPDEPEAKARLSLVDRKGGDWTEWPEDLRVREFPAAGAEEVGGV